MTLILAYQNRGTSLDIVIKDSAGTAIAPAAGDEIRATIYREGLTPQLVVTSAQATTNGSSFEKNTPSDGTNLLRLDAQDLSFDPGTYTLMIDLLDHADGDEWKTVDRQVFTLEKT